ncbi:MAG: peptidyl-prolyl cis-trans isomerase [Pedosphaera sp.]|nr:peptidyl-prolyl cis-trans isomerase [Pedosphaera sp.]
MRSSLFLLAVLAGAPLLSAQPAATAPREALVNQIVAIVGSKVITEQDVKGDERWMAATDRFEDLGQYMRHLQSQYEKATQAGNKEQAANVQREMVRLESDANRALTFRFSLALNTLIDRQLVLQGTKSNERFAEPPGLVDKLFADHLRERKLTQAQLAQKLHQEGSSLPQLRGELFDKWLVDVALYKSITVSPRKVKEYYDAHPEVYKLGEAVDLHLITLLKAGTPQERAEAMAREIKTLADFKAKAKEFRVERDGARGWLGRKDTSLSKEIMAAAFEAKAGEAKLVGGAEVNFLIFVSERRADHQVSFADATPEIERILAGQQLQEHHDRKIGQMKKQFFVVRFDSSAR